MRDYPNKDCLRLLNLKHANEIVEFDDDGLWKYIVERVEEVKDVKDKFKLNTWLFISLNKSFELFEKRFIGMLECECDYQELIYDLILDFAFEGRLIKLDYYGIGGFYDNPASCETKHSDQIMPEKHPESDDFNHRVKFYLLEAAHLDKIIEALEKYSDKLTENTPEDIAEIKQLRDKCRADENYKVAYVYDND